MPCLIKKYVLELKRVLVLNSLLQEGSSLIKSYKLCHSFKLTVLASDLLDLHSRSTAGLQASCETKFYLLKNKTENGALKVFSV